MKYTNKSKAPLDKERGKILQRMSKLEAKETKNRQEKDNLHTVINDLQSALDSAKDLIMVLDTNFTIIKANLATSRFLKLSLNEIIGKTCYELIHGIDNLPRECPLTMIKKSKKHEETECFLAGKDLWLHVSSDPIFDKTGRMTKIVHIIRDITEFRRTEASLRESEGRFRAVFDYADHGIYIMDLKERKALMVNRRLCQMLGYSKEELTGLKADDIYPQQDVPFVIEQLRQLLREEIDIAKNISLLRKDGSLLYVHVSAAPFVLGGKTHLMCIFREIVGHKTVS